MRDSMTQADVDIQLAKFQLIKPVLDLNDADGCYWQAVMNVGYAQWQDENSQVDNYPDMVQWMEHNYGEFASMAILLGKYNQQVCNGGHHQYFDNGYASRFMVEESSFVRYYEDKELHVELKSLVEDYLEIEIQDYLASHLSDFNIIPVVCEYCEGTGFDDADCPCYECNGSGDGPGFMVNNASDLDESYYELCNDVEKQCIEFYKNLLC